MTLFHYEEDLQYFREKAKNAPKDKKEIAENVVRLLMEAEEIYLSKTEVAE